MPPNRSGTQSGRERAGQPGQLRWRRRTSPRPPRPRARASGAGRPGLRLHGLADVAEHHHPARLADRADPDQVDRFPAGAPGAGDGRAQRDPCARPVRDLPARPPGRPVGGRRRAATSPSSAQLGGVQLLERAGRPGPPPRSAAAAAGARVVRRVVLGGRDGRRQGGPGQAAARLLRRRERPAPGRTARRDCPAGCRGDAGLRDSTPASLNTAAKTASNAASSSWRRTRLIRAVQYSRPHRRRRAHRERPDEVLAAGQPDRHARLGAAARPRATAKAARSTPAQQAAICGQRGRPPRPRRSPPTPTATGTSRLRIEPPASSIRSSGSGSA